jgi:hypothetical protein
MFVSQPDTSPSAQPDPAPTDVRTRTMTTRIPMSVRREVAPLRSEKSTRSKAKDPADGSAEQEPNSGERRAGRAHHGAKREHGLKSQ